MATTDPRPSWARGEEASRLVADDWLPSPEAARALGVSLRTLKRYGAADGFLVPGQHWISGAFANSPTRWDVPACREVIHRRGIKVKAAMQLGRRLPVLARIEG